MLRAAPILVALTAWLASGFTAVCAQSSGRRPPSPFEEFQRNAERDERRGGREDFPPLPFRGGNSGSLIRLEGGGVVDEETVRTARETASHSTGTPEWSNPRAFEKDVFTFARVIFRSNSNRYGYGGRTGWANDYPDSDLNLSWRLQQLTSARVDPDGRVLKLTHSDLHDFPLVYMVKPGRMELTDEEAVLLRGYLLNGGALVTDDTWGAQEWQNIEREMRRVLPGRAWSDVPREHAIFNGVFRLDRDKLQIPPIQRWLRSGSSSRGGEDTERAYFRAWFDDKGRMIVFAAHNTDLGDGWEREGESDEYFHTFSETRAYPMAVNILFYFMTH